MPDSDDVFATLLPRLAQLSATLNRGRLYERVIEAVGTTLERPAMTILITLNAADGPLRVGEIATKMEVAGPHVTRSVHGLESRGLVERVPDADDARARLITLTEDGRKIANQYVGVIRGWFADALGDWSARDREHLNRLLGRMIDDLGSHFAHLADS